MNKVVLIGNGFDLAHGLKTSYKDFIVWYWNDWGRRLLQGADREESDGLCSFKLNDTIEYNSWSYIWGYYYQRNNPFIPWDPNVVSKIAQEDRNLCKFTFCSRLLERIRNEFLYGWVDIEAVYFSLLTENRTSLKGIIRPNFKELNDQLDILRGRLIDYLRLEEDKPVGALEKIKDKIICPIRRNELSLSSNKYTLGNLKDVIEPSKVLLLNFNYTKTPEMYMHDQKKISINYIHGKLDNPESVIFGYGDELSECYKYLSDLGNNECLRNIKSIRYLESDNYRKFLEFIESAPFQVCIMGHSCGNSDRTLLNTLFEHHHCVSVKPYYYIDKEGKDNYLDLAQNISRNFTDMKLMRDRVVNKRYCEPLA